MWPAVYSDQWASAQQTVKTLHVGGVVLMKPSNAFADVLHSNLSSLKALSRHGLLVATDEEGGEVQRLSELGLLPSEQEMSGKSSAEIAAIVAAHAKVVAKAGIDVVFAPVVDVRPVAGKDPLGQGRLFVGDGARVATLAAIYVHAWEAAGVLPVLKHFPGHGSASANTETKLATTPPLAQLLLRDLVPYEQLVGSGAGVMVGHLAVPGLTDGKPASQSAAAVDLLRNRLGYGDALVISDALGMGAVGAPVPEAAVRAIAAGIDVVEFTGTVDTKAVIDAIEQAVQQGRLTVAQIGVSATRVARVLAAHGTACASA